MGGSPVLIVDAGPVGTTLALELAFHGVQAMVVDRSTTSSRHPKMSFINGRSMELMRRLGLVPEIRARGVAPEHSFNFHWIHALTDRPVATWEYDSVELVRKRIAGTNDGTAPLEPYQRLQGSLLESILRERSRADPSIELLEGWPLTGFAVDGGPSGDEVTATIACARTGAERTVRARFLVGCDGANSFVRERTGITLTSEAPPTRHCDVYATGTSDRRWSPPTPHRNRRGTGSGSCPPPGRAGERRTCSSATAPPCSTGSAPT